MLFIKYSSDKYGDSDDFAPPVTIPKGASFKDMIALKGKDGIGDKINTQIIQKLVDANSRLSRQDFPDFNGHLRGGIPERDIDGLDRYWLVLPSVRARLFKKAKHAGYYKLTNDNVKPAILEHSEFIDFRTGVDKQFAKWKKPNALHLKSFAIDGHPKVLIVHEMVHLPEPTHNETFVTILDKHYPKWRDVRAELNELPLSAELWNR